jgi:predicted kinase
METMIPTPLSTQLAWIPRPPDFRLDWQAIEADCPWLASLATVQQNPIYHGEGDVFTHTRMVAEALIELVAWRTLPSDQRAILFLAALLHDYGKADTTRLEDGRWVSPGHARVGATHTRWMLRADSGVGRALPLKEREALAGLVLLHGLPLHFLDRPDLDRMLISASYRSPLAQIALLAEADVRGRICGDQAELLARIDLFRSWYQEHSCADQPFAFASDHSRVRYLRGYQADPFYQAYDDTWGEVTMLAGLPGVGKDHWYARHGPDQPIISLDIIRADLGIDPSEPQGVVVHYAKAQARNYLRNRQPFIWNATNLTRQLRDPLIDLFLAYHARVRIVYLDAPLTNILARNQQRHTSVPHEVILRLAGKADPPTLAEAHQVAWLDG